MSSPQPPSDPPDEGQSDGPAPPTDSSSPSHSSVSADRPSSGSPAPPSPPSHDFEEALRCLRVERRVLGDERSAFRVFADRLLATDGTVRTATIESHYRETVMAVPHYESEYGDEFLDSVAAEFGTILAVDCQQRDRLDEPTVGALRAAAERCRASRDRVVDLIDAERHSVTSADEALDAIVDRVEALDGGGDADRLRLTLCRERCDDVARERREYLQSDAGTSDGEDPIATGRLQSLCYRELPTDRPVLAAVEALRRAIERRRQDVVGARRVRR